MTECDPGRLYSYAPLGRRRRTVEESAPRPWHARTFADATVQRLSVALQRGVQEDQLLRAHVRRTRHLFGVNDGGAPGGGAATESVVARAGAARRAECRCT